MTDRKLSFTEAERARLREACRCLGTSFVEFIHHSTMQAVDEVLGTSAEVSRSRTLDRPEGADGPG